MIGFIGYADLVAFIGDAESAAGDDGDDGAMNFSASGNSGLLAFLEDI